jgi:succinate dehydrogenase/fumarate reductase flavoprotein subunit
VPESELRAAFGPVIDRLADNGIDLTARPIEVAPIAHYHMGGIRVDERMQTCVPGLYAAGEAVGGANGANRLSGNAIPEAFVFGERAGRFAADAVRDERHAWEASAAGPALDTLQRMTGRPAQEPASPALGEMMTELQALMWDNVGLLRDEEKLTGALVRLRAMRCDDLPALAPGGGTFSLAAQDWFDLRASLLCAESVAHAALERRESRGAHQREDFPDTDPAQAENRVLRLADGDLESESVPVRRAPVALEPLEAAS